MKEENIEKTDEKTYGIKTNKKKIIIASVCIGVIILLAFVFSTIFALVNLNNINIISGIKVNGIDIGKLSKEETIQKLNDETNKKLESDILIKVDGFEYGIKLSQIETKYNVEKALDEAYNTGRNGNIFINNYEILKTTLFGKNINLEYTYNEELLDKTLNDINLKIPNCVVEASYCIEDEKLIITKGKKGVSINTEEIKQAIMNEFLSSNKGIEINVSLIEKNPLPIDIDKIYEEVHTEPKNAYYTKEPFKVFPHVDGIDFDLENAKEILKEDKEEYEIDLTITRPDVTTNEIGTEAFPDLLSSFSTRYDASNYPRTTNLRLAMGKLNGVVVAPGETFSYNKTLGKRTAEAGYREAGGYAAGGVVQTLAGGICQISSTLYDAVVYANLDIVERHNHMFLAGYVGAGKDATVVYGSLDFKFKNTRDYPIMIKTSIGNGVAKVDIYGIKEEVEYDVDIVTSVLSYIPFKVVYKEDSSLEPGQEKVEQNGMNGCRSITYKVVRLNGVEISREVLSSDSYDPMNKIIKKGPEKTVETNKDNNDKEETKKPTTSENKKPTNTETNKNEEKEPIKNDTTTQKPKPKPETKPNTDTTTQKPSTNNKDESTNSEGQDVETENNQENKEEIDVNKENEENIETGEQGNNTDITEETSNGSNE